MAMGGRKRRRSSLLALVWQGISVKAVELWPSPIGIAKKASRSAVSAGFAALTGYQENGNGSSVGVQCR